MSEVQELLARIGATNSLGGARTYDDIGIGSRRIDTRFESTFDIIRRAAVDAHTPNILGTSDTVEAIVLRSEAVSPDAEMAPTMAPGGLDRIAVCRVISGQHTTLLPDPLSLDPTDVRSQSLISAFPRFRYSSMVWGIIPPGIPVRVTFDPGTLSSGVLNSASGGLSAMGEIYMPAAGAPGGLPGQFAFPTPPPDFLGNVMPGPTPNADALRAVLKELGYKEKFIPPSTIGEISSSGVDITAEMSKAASAVFKTIKQTVPDVTIKVTGGNDAFHYGLVCVGGAWGSGGRRRDGVNKKCYTSRHTKGRGIDFCVIPAKAANVAAVETVLQGFGAGNDNQFRYLNEYAKPTSAATKKHFHMSWGGGREGLDELAVAKQLAAAGQITTFPISGFYA